MLFNRKPKLTEHQFDRLSNIFDGAGQVIFGVIVLSPFIQRLDQINFIVIILGLITAISFWIFSVLIARKVR